MDNKQQPTNEQFCKFHTGYYGEGIDNVKQLVHTSFSGEELVEYLQAFTVFMNKLVPSPEASEPTHAEIAQVPSVEDKTPSAEEYLFEFSKNYKRGMERIHYEELAESYAQLRVEQAKDEWDKEKELIVKEMAKSLIEHTENYLSYPMNIGGDIEFQKGYRKSQTEYIEFMKMVYKTE